VKRSHRAALILSGAVTVAEAAVVAQRRGSWFKADTVVRCRAGHLFTTFWIPGGSLKALRLGPWRLQHCPVGRHWTLVTPVAISELTLSEREIARRHDARIP
jgi:hypothetical protein